MRQKKKTLEMPTVFNNFCKKQQVYSKTEKELFNIQNEYFEMY